MKTLQEFTIVFDHDAMIQALAASLVRTRTVKEEKDDEEEGDLT